MTLEVLTNIGARYGWDNPVAGVPDLKSVLTELQGLKIDVIRGADTASVDLSISGAATTDTILMAMRFNASAESGIASIDQLTATNFKIRSAGNVRHTAVTKIIDQIIIFWYDKA